jgi:hypothetical protein
MPERRYRAIVDLRHANCFPRRRETPGMANNVGGSEHIARALLGGALLLMALTG